jgi:hypothetical protein
MHRNRILQKRLDALWEETQRILRSETIKPENQQQKSQESSHSEDSSRTKIVIPILPPVRIVAPRPYRDDDKFAIKATLEKIHGWLDKKNVNKEAKVCAE